MLALQYDPPIPPLFAGFSVIFFGGPRGGDFCSGFFRQLLGVGDSLPERFFPDFSAGKNPLDRNVHWENDIIVFPMHISVRASKSLVF